MKFEEQFPSLKDKTILFERSVSTDDHLKVIYESDVQRYCQDNELVEK